VEAKTTARIGGSPSVVHRGATGAGLGGAADDAGAVNECLASWAFKLDLMLARVSQGPACYIYVFIGFNKAPKMLSRYHAEMSGSRTPAKIICDAHR
jgi:hypothetical protein